MCNIHQHSKTAKLPLLAALRECTIPTSISGLLCLYFCRQWEKISVLFLYSEESSILMMRVKSKASMNGECVCVCPSVTAAGTFLSFTGASDHQHNSSLSLSLSFRLLHNNNVVKTKFLCLFKKQMDLWKWLKHCTTHDRPLVGDHFVKNHYFLVDMVNVDK